MSYPKTGFVEWQYKQPIIVLNCFWLLRKNEAGYTFISARLPKDVYKLLLVCHL